MENIGCFGVVSYRWFGSQLRRRSGCTAFHCPLQLRIDPKPERGAKCRVKLVQYSVSYCQISSRCRSGILLDDGGAQSSRARSRARSAKRSIGRTCSLPCTGRRLRGATATGWIAPVTRSPLWWGDMRSDDGLRRSNIATRSRKAAKHPGYLGRAAFSALPMPPWKQS
jgi:hypothetical protein